MTGHEMEFLAQAVKDGLKLGQSVHHVFASREDLPCSDRSFCRHVENEAIDVRKMNLRKKMKHRKRDQKKANHHEAEFYAGRSYDDYLALPEEERARAVQMDCVEGAQGDTRAILTLRFASLRFQIYVLLKRKDAEHVVAALDWLESLVGTRTFKRLSGLILVERGCEFDDIASIEAKGRCSVYYTDPQRPNQKGGYEKNHVELHKIIPKRTSIDSLALDQWLMAGICSHVNSGLRPSIGDASPMALAKVALPASLLEGLDFEAVLPGKVETRSELIDRLKREQAKAKQEKSNSSGRQRQGQSSKSKACAKSGTDIGRPASACPKTRQCSHKAELALPNERKKPSNTAIRPALSHATALTPPTCTKFGNQPETIGTPSPKTQEPLALLRGKTKCVRQQIGNLLYRVRAIRIL